MKYRIFTTSYDNNSEVEGGSGLVVGKCQGLSYQKGRSLASRVNSLRSERRGNIDKI